MLQPSLQQSIFFIGYYYSCSTAAHYILFLSYRESHFPCKMSFIRTYFLVHHYTCFFSSQCSRKLWFAMLKSENFFTFGDMELNYNPCLTSRLF
uniref:Coenzyme Q3, methyltransferase n=1 Tax=Cannabis sativa TaxID=3483 RepID=A0A803RBF1_CANSA